jgi:hypothetical protein
MRWFTKREVEVLVQRMLGYEKEDDTKGGGQSFLELNERKEEEKKERANYVHMEDGGLLRHSHT